MNSISIKEIGRHLLSSKAYTTGRICLVFLLCSIVQVFSSESHSQIATLTLRLNNVPVEEVLNQIENQTEFRFLYNKNLIDVTRKVSIHVEKENITHVLDALFNAQKIHYSINAHQIVLNRETDNTGFSQQKKTLTGRVTDMNGEPVIGANVVVTGSTNGTITDINGKFTLEAPENAMLKISYIGYIDQELPVKGKKSLSIVLHEDTRKLDEVVVVGYGTQKKVNLTGAVSTVKADMLENRTTADPVNMLTGQIAGVTIIQNSGQPGDDGAALRVRGVGTLGNSEAMVIVDGIESSFNSVSPNDIENISVLKDAAASAIYGVRAANGVILITTKRGAVGKPVVSYDGYVGWQSATRVPRYLDSYNYAVLKNESLTNDGSSPIFSDSDLQKFKDGSDRDHYPDSDWLGALLSENGLFHNHHLSIVGGNEGVRYALLVGYHNKEGLIPNTKYNRFNVRSNIDAKINSRLDVSLNMAAYRDDSKQPATKMRTLMYEAFRATPDAPMQFSNGTYGLFLNNFNPLAEVRNGGFTRTTNSNFQGNASFTYKIIDGLTLKGSAATTFNLEDMQFFQKRLSYYNAEGNEVKNTRSKAENKDNKMLEINLQAYLNYEKTVGKHTVKGLLGYSQIRNSYRILGASRYDLPDNNSLSEINAGDVTTQTTEGKKIAYALRSGFARLNYGFDNRYLLEANIRYDGTSRFPSDNRFGAFPSFSAGWRISEEAFMQPITWIDNLKLRASWGQLGNQEIGDYAFYNTYVFGQDYSYGNVLTPGISINETMANTGITWEKTSQVDVGIDADFMKGKLSFTGDFFLKNTKDILLNLPIPSIVGVEAPTQNAGKVRNIGVELQLSHQNQIRDWKYSASFNFTYVHNEITDLSGGDTPGRSVGDPVNNIYGYVCDGIFKSQEEIDASPKQVWGAVPGDLKYRDISGPDGKPDGIVDNRDRKSIGSYFPKINFGLHLGMEYKHIDFSALLQGAASVDAIVSSEINKAFYNGGKVADIHLDRWTPQNTDASYPRLSASDSDKNYSTSTFWMQNASYLKLRNLQIGYTLPGNLTGQIGVARLRFYFSADNLFTLTGFDGVDPESAYNMKDLTKSSTYYPLTRNYSFGVNVSF